MDDDAPRLGAIVIRPGAFATIQDLGRPGHRASGVPPGGAFDEGSHRLANALLGNPGDCATLEMTMWGVALQALSPIALAWAGAPMEAHWITTSGRKRLAAVPRTLNLDAGDRIEFGTASRGLRAYLATQGGWRTPMVLGSRSRETPLRAGDVLPCLSGRTEIRWLAEPVLSLPSDGPIRLIAGPDANDGERLSLDGVTAQVEPQSNRMGLRLRWDWRPPSGKGPSATKISAPVAPGAIQWTGPDSAIALGPACGTMGGYTHVAHCVSADLDRLAQARPGDTLRFVAIDDEEAWRLDREDRNARTNWVRRIARTRGLESD